MSSAEQALFEEVIPIPTAGVDVATEVPFEGRASFEGPLSETLEPLSELHEESLGLAKPVSGPALRAEALDESVTSQCPVSRGRRKATNSKWG